MRNWLRSSRTRLRPWAMKASKRSVNEDMRARRSSKPKFRLGRVSAMEGAVDVERGGRMAEVERLGSKRVDILRVGDLVFVCV